MRRKCGAGYRTGASTEILEWGPAGGVTCEIFVSAGYDEFGRLREAFVRVGGRVGSHRDFLLDDIAALISRRLQHEDSLDSMAAGMGRDEAGQPTSLVGAVIDLLVGMQVEYQMAGAAGQQPEVTRCPD